MTSSYDTYMAIYYMCIASMFLSDKFYSTHIGTRSENYKRQIIKIISRLYNII